MVLATRDLDLLTLVALTRGATTAQVARLLFPTEDRARRRLRTLFEARLVDVSLTSSTAPNLITLTRYGKNALVEARPSLANRVVVTRPPAPHAARHHVLVADLRIYLILLERQGILQDLVVHSPPADLVSWRPHRLIPDAVAEATIGGETTVLALEADRGVEAAVVLEEKFERYVEALGRGVADRVVVGVEGGDDEARRVARIAQTVGLGEATVVIGRPSLVRGDGAPLRRTTRAHESRTD